MILKRILGLPNQDYDDNAAIIGQMRQLSRKRQQRTGSTDLTGTAGYKDDSGGTLSGATANQQHSGGALGPPDLSAASEHNMSADKGAFAGLQGPEERQTVRARRPAVGTTLSSTRKPIRAKQSPDDGNTQGGRAIGNIAPSGRRRHHPFCAKRRE